MPKKPIKKVSNKSKIAKDNKKLLIEEDKEFYLSIWEYSDLEYQQHCCYECGKGLSEPLTLYFHHILEKRNYPEFRHIKINIAILCWNCHNQAEINIDKTPKTKLLTEKIKKELL